MASPATGFAGYPSAARTTPIAARGSISSRTCERSPRAAASSAGTMSPATRIMSGCVSPRVELEDAQPPRREHEPRVERAAEGAAAPRELPQGRQEHALLHLARHLGRHVRRGREGAHAAGVRSLIAVADALVVLRRREEPHALAVRERDHARLGALEPLLDDDLRAGPAVDAADEHVAERRLGLARAARDDDALAGGE